MSILEVVIPFRRGGNEDWLAQAKAALPASVTVTVAENDGELAEALNEAIRTSEAEFVFRLDADDMIDEESLAFLLSASWDADVVYPSLLLIDEQGAPISWRKAPAFCPHRLRVAPYFSGCALMRREKVLEVGGYKDLPILEDWELWCRLSAAGGRFKGIPEARYVYRQHPGSRNKSEKERRAVLDGMRANGVGPEPHLEASFYYQALLPTTYWRCLLPARYLPGQAIDQVNLEPIQDGDTVTGLDFVDHRGAAVWQFPGMSTEAVMMAEMQEQGIRVLVESDDSYFERSPQGTPGWGTNLGDAPYSLEAHRKIIPWVDGVIVTTQHLAKRYRKHTDVPVYVCPNQIEPADWPEPQQQEDRIRVGWFASPSHKEDGRLIKSALEWASRQDGVEVVTMGYDPEWKFRRAHIPWSNDIGIYRHVISQWHIGLAPVVESAWSACRSDLKALEYGAVAAAPVLSRATPYASYEGPALYAKTPKEFLHHLKDLIRDPQAARELGRAAREHVLAERTVEGNIGRWQEAIHG